MDNYDLIIIGGGPAGLSAAIYALRYKLDLIIFSKNIGGTAATAHKICNFPSYNDIKGYELMNKFIDHAKGLGAKIIYDEIIKIEKKEKGFRLYTKKEKYECKKIIYAVGTERNRLKVPGEARLHGKGVSYCATCDAAFFKDKFVSVVGGGEAALTAALLLAEYAREVYIIYRKDRFTKSDPTWIDLVQQNKKIKTIFNEEIVEIIGKESVEKIRLKSGKEINVQGVFVEIGGKPKTDILKGLNVKLDKNGYIIVDRGQQTNVSGLFAAGDVTNNELKQILTAAAEGAIASHSVYKEIKEERKN